MGAAPAPAAPPGSPSRSRNTIPRTTRAAAGRSTPATSRTSPTTPTCSPATATISTSSTPRRATTSSSPLRVPAERPGSGGQRPLPGARPGVGSAPAVGGGVHQPRRFSRLKAYFTQAVNNNFTNLLATIIPSATAAQGEATGWLPGGYGSGSPRWRPGSRIISPRWWRWPPSRATPRPSRCCTGRATTSSAASCRPPTASIRMTASPTTWWSAPIPDRSSRPGRRSSRPPPGPASAANFSGQWAALEYPGYQAWALATLASTITVEQSPDAIQAYGWLPPTPRSTPPGRPPRRSTTSSPASPTATC